MRQIRQPPEDGGSLLRVVVRHHLTRWLVISQHAGWRRRDAVAHRLAVELNAVAERNALARVGHFAVDRDSALANHLLEIAA